MSLTLLAVLCWCRLTEMTDSLVELFIDLVRMINTRAERRVERQQIAEFRRVSDKENVLFKLAGASVAHPDGLVRDVVFPAVGEQTLKNLVAEAKATESLRRQRVRTVLASSYSHHYRTMLPKLLNALEFRCNNTTYRPVMDAVDLLHRYKDRDGRATHYERADRVPLDGVVQAQWRAAVVDERGRVERIPYELCALQALRDALRRREIWVVGARAWRNPETDLPVDFEVHRDVHYTAIAQPTDPTEFVSALRARLDASLARWAEAMRTGIAGTSVGTRKGQVWISVSKQPAQPVPANLDAVKDEVTLRWGVVSLLDLLKEADWLTGLHTEFTSIATREHLAPGELRKRLLLVLFALGTNIGIKRIINAGDHGVTEAQLRRTRHLFVNRDGLRRAIAAVVGETLRGRDPRWWGDGTACASDSKKFRSWESNLMTEWHARYGGPGVMIYWHVERKSVCVYSQLKTCSSSIADYLAAPALRREIHEGLQVVEQWNSANVAIHYGREAELPGADREAQEISMLALHLLQSALVLVNIRMVDRVLDDPDWAGRLTEHDRRGLTPLFWSNVALHGTFTLDLDKRLDYDRRPAAQPDPAQQ
ncbi:Tn3 family transposase [Micromonospora sp. NPDC051925]|uniref:Tn3 family transposase n=1 Tax=Micromonospora sp. NPDC051925 TaxID=3364288 RepID=UPI0037CA1BE6